MSARVVQFFLASLLIVLIFNRCLWSDWGEFKESLQNWQKEQIKKRYGSAYVNKEKIPDWQEEIREYEAIIDEKIEASSRLAAVHRKLGESFAEIGSYEQCIQSLSSALKLGIHDPDMLYKLALCKGNLAQKNNWKHSLTKQAEQSFLSLLNIDENYEKAKFQLGLIYFYGFGSNNRYRVLNDYITVTQQQYRKKALNLLLQYKHKESNDYKVYFALTNVYKVTGEISKAGTQMREFIEMLKKNYPNNYQNIKEYKSALQNLSFLGVVK